MDCTAATGTLRMASRNRHRAPRAQDASLRERGKAWFNEGCCKPFHFRTRLGPARGEGGGPCLSGLQGQCLCSVSGETGVILGDHLQGQSAFMCGLLLNGSLVPTISSMWPGPTIPISRMGKQPWGLLEITQAGGAELTPESGPRIESPASNILQH